MEYRQESSRNYNLDLLKMLCAFLVIVVHFGKNSIFHSFGGIAVPVFMILAFYFFYPKITSIDIKQRIKKLFIPLFGWAVLYFVVYYFFLHMHRIPVDDIFWQTITGHCSKLNPSMWFQNNLIILTMFSFVIFKKFRNHFLEIMLCCCFIAYVLQYSDINYAIFESLRSKFKYPLGRILEMVPFVVVGIILAKYNILNYFKEKYIYWWVALFVFINTLVTISVPKGFGYSGIKLCLLSILIILVFNSIPEGSKLYKNTLRFITQNTLGIYCIHRLVEKILHPYIFVDYNTVYCLIIFIISWAICYGISKIPSKNIQALVK